MTLLVGAVRLPHRDEDEEEEEGPEQLDNQLNLEQEEKNIKSRLYSDFDL